MGSGEAAVPSAPPAAQVESSRGPLQATKRDVPRATGPETARAGTTSHPSLKKQHIYNDGVVDGPPGQSADRPGCKLRKRSKGVHLERGRQRRCSPGRELGPKSTVHIYRCSSGKSTRPLMSPQTGRAMCSAAAKLRGTGHRGCSGPRRRATSPSSHHLSNYLMSHCVACLLRVRSGHSATQWWTYGNGCSQRCRAGELLCGHNVNDQYTVHA
jgi:hypothetical protein